MKIGFIENSNCIALRWHLSSAWWHSYALGSSFSRRGMPKHPFSSIVQISQEKLYSQVSSAKSYCHLTWSEASSGLWILEEVWSTICDFPPDNAPGPDGFIGRFHRASWGNIKEDMSLAPDAVHRSQVFKFKLLNTTIIMLLLKKVDALQVKDYQPISLIHSFAKLV